MPLAPTLLSPGNWLPGSASGSVNPRSGPSPLGHPCSPHTSGPSPIPPADVAWREAPHSAQLPRKAGVQGAGCPALVSEKPPPGWADLVFLFLKYFMERDPRVGPHGAALFSARSWAPSLGQGALPCWSSLRGKNPRGHVPHVPPWQLFHGVKPQWRPQTPINSYTVGLRPASHTAVLGPRGFARQTQVPGGTGPCARPARGPQSPCLSSSHPGPHPQERGLPHASVGSGWGFPACVHSCQLPCGCGGSGTKVDRRRGLSTHRSVVPPSKGGMATLTPAPAEMDLQTLCLGTGPVMGAQERPQEVLGGVLSTETQGRTWVPGAAEQLGERLS